MVMSSKHSEEYYATVQSEECSHLQGSVCSIVACMEAVMSFLCM